VERLPSGHEFTSAIQALERYLGITITAVHGMEAGGVNALIPVAVAAWLGLPLVDADGMGRAFPRIEQTVFTLAGLPASPAALADLSGNELILTGADNAAVERMARAALPALGGWAAAALYPMRAGASARYALPGGIDRALHIGRCLRAAQASGQREERRRFLAETSGCLLFMGTVLEVRQRTAGAHGVVTVEHAADPGRTLRIEMADEYLLALDDGEITGCVPEIISVLDARSWRPISAERVADGQYVHVLRFPAPPQWDHPRARALGGPVAFGLDPGEGLRSRAGEEPCRTGGGQTRPERQFRPGGGSA